MSLVEAGESDGLSTSVTWNSKDTREGEFYKILRD